MAGENDSKQKRCVDLHTFHTAEWEYGKYSETNGKFEVTNILEAKVQRAKLIACIHCTYIREIQYKN